MKQILNDKRQADHSDSSTSGRFRAVKLIESRVPIGIVNDHHFHDFMIGLSLKSPETRSCQSSGKHDLPKAARDPQNGSVISELAASMVTPAPAALANGSDQQHQAIAPSVLVVFDYDDSLVDTDSDLFVFRELHPALLEEIRDRYMHTQWTQLIDELMLKLSVEKPTLTVQDIEQTLARIPVQPMMLDAVRLAAQSHGAVVHIVSDANTLFIQSMLDAQGLAPLVSEVHSNPARFEETIGDDGITAVQSNRLCIEWYHARHLEPHGCPHCQLNMCKGRIIDRTLSQRKFDHVLYVGDGKGDYCPATKLSRDIVFARSDGPDGKQYGLLQKISENRDTVQASVVPWTTGGDIFNHFHQFFSQLAAKPTF